MEAARQRCRKILEENLDSLHAIAAALLERETITGDDIDLLIQGKPLPPFDPGRPEPAPVRPAEDRPTPSDDGATFTLHSESDVAPESSEGPDNAAREKTKGGETDGKTDEPELPETPQEKEKKEGDILGDSGAQAGLDNNFGREMPPEDDKTDHR